jgi:trimeric autotransporter adhesin
MKTIVPLFRVVLTILCVGSFRQTQAVVPPPDGGYPNFTTAEGTNALKNLNGGVGNTAAGWYSLFTNSTASYNTAVGAATLLFNNADSNTAIGTAALLFNTSGSNNTAVGTGALVNNDNGEHNTAVGAFALSSNTGGMDRGSDNTATGYQALFSNLGDVTNTGILNTATGSQALYSNTVARFNCGFGVKALFSNTIGEDNNAFGYQALFNSVNGFANSAFGKFALLSNLDGQQNSAFGNSALVNNVHGDRNIAVGVAAGGMIDGDGNVCIGAFVQGEAGVNDTTYIRNVNTLAQPIVMGTDGVTVRLSDGRLGHGVSSRRYKQDIKPMDKASEALYALKPVTFHYNKEIDPTQTLDFGLVAEEVAEVNPELAVRDGQGKISNYRRDAINAMLLNEFLKAHRRIEQQEATIAQLKADGANQQAVISDLKKRLETLVVRLDQQDSKIERVNDQLEPRQPVPQLAATNP